MKRVKNPAPPMVTYSCSHCGKILRREQTETPPKQWRKSFCERVGKDVRITLVKGGAS